MDHIEKQCLGFGLNILKEYTLDKKFPKIYTDSNNLYTDIVGNTVDEEDGYHLFCNGWAVIDDFWVFPCGDNNAR